jgi:uncharacterized protein involved in cysteine biosynthesis
MARLNPIWGVTQFVSALQFLKTHRLKKWYIIPSLLTLPVFLGLVWIFKDYTLEFIQYFWKGAQEYAGWIEFFGAAFGGLITYFLFAPLTMTIAYPLMDPLAAKVEAVELGQAINPGTFLSQLLYSIIQAIKFGIFSLCVAILGLILSFVIPVIGTAIAFCLIAYVLALELFDIPLSRRHYSFTAKLKFVSANIMPCLALGSVFAALIYVPGGFIIAIPAGVVAAARMVIAIEGKSEEKLSELTP